MWHTLPNRQHGLNTNLNMPQSRPRSIKRPTGYNVKAKRDRQKAAQEVHAKAAAERRRYILEVCEPTASRFYQAVKAFNDARGRAIREANLHKAADEEIIALAGIPHEYRHNVKLYHQIKPHPSVRLRDEPTLTLH
jgi:hypothetical protein